MASGYHDPSVSWPFVQSKDPSPLSLPNHLCRSLLAHFCYGLLCYGLLGHCGDAASQSVLPYFAFGEFDITPRIHLISASNIRSWGGRPSNDCSGPCTYCLDSILPSTSGFVSQVLDLSVVQCAPNKVFIVITGTVVRTTPCKIVLCTVLYINCINTTHLDEPYLWRSPKIFAPYKINKRQNVAPKRERSLSATRQALGSYHPKFV
ncbi:hypothetical protein V8C37DRAFT_245613 [Trichoderma ceciliae]